MAATLAVGQEYLDLLFALMDGCRQRGCYHVHLADGTDFHLDPTWHHARTAPPHLATETLQGGAEAATLRRDDIAAELDRELFGKSLE